MQKQQSRGVHTKMTKALGSSDKGFKTTVIKMLQWAVINESMLSSTQK